MFSSRFEGLLQDLRYTFRTLRKDAAFTAFAVLIVGLGIGASTTLFSVVNTLLLRPLPFRDPERLAWVTNYKTGGLSGATTQVGILLDLRARNQSFSDLAGYMAFYGVGDNVLSGKGEPERLSGVPVSENFFPVLGVGPQIGRLFSHDECKWNGPKVALISHGLWVRRFASDPGIVGRALTLDNEPVTVVGVMPAWFDFASIFAPASHIDLYFPFPLSPETNRWGNTMAIVGRLKPGVSTAQAQAEVKILGAQLNAAHLANRNDFEGWVTPLKEHVSGGLRLALIVLSCGVGAVMLIVCANLSNLLLARMAARRKEIAIRTALGAGRGRLVRQMLTEGIALSMSGAALGVLLAIAGTRALAHLDAVSIPLLQDVHLDGAALGYTLAMALLTGVIFGLAPAFHTPVSAMQDALKDSSRGSTEGKERSWIRSALVVSEIAFACVLLVGAGLLMRSFLSVLDVNIGFQPERAMSVRVDPDSRYRTQAQQNAYFDEVLRRTRAVPGVQGAGLTDALPLGRNRAWGAPAKGVVYGPGEFPDAFVRVVSDGYAGAMGIPLREGRDLSERDTPKTEPVIMVNETMARRLWPGQDALGKIIAGACGGDRRVVGIVGDVRHLALEEGAGNEMYLPIRQCQDWSSVDLVVRTTGAPEEIGGGVRDALKQVAPNISPKEFRSLERLVDKSVSPRRFVVTLAGGFAVFALILASLGIYALISYSVTQRTQEIGIRMALGASAGDLQAGIIFETLRLAAAGMLVGATAAWLLARLLRGLLFGVTATDPVTFIGMLAVLAVVAAIAGYVPAYRASRIDPAVALRAS
ncbi:MAG TPA: ABC transporter permease [Bryobacteraceae bacterium]|jgi:predicted permease|nr:ABC transporter permease [Bryobacteraceae bacterium]